eukprot:3909280-Amphidinium_carterae.1
MLHWLDSADKAAGCGWQPSRKSKIQLLLTDEDWQSRPGLLSQCVHCFKHKSLPAPWATELEMQDVSSDEVSSTSVSS